MQADGHRLQLPAGLDNAVQRRLRLEMVPRLPDLNPRHFRNQSAGPPRKLGMRIHPRAYRRPPQRHLRQRRLGPAHAGYAVLRLPRVAAELLPQPHRRGVLQMRPPRLDDRPELVRLLLQRRPQRLQRRPQILLHPQQRRQVNRRRNHIVGRLPQVHLVVGMNQPRPQVAPQQLRSPVGDNLVGVGIGGSAGTRLENIQHKMGIMPPVRHLLRRGHNSRPRPGVQRSQRHIRPRRRQLDDAQRADELARKTQVADGKIKHGAHRRRPVQRLGGNCHLAHRIAFNAGAGVGSGHR